MKKSGSFKQALILLILISIGPASQGMIMNHHDFEVAVRNRCGGPWDNKRYNPACNLSSSTTSLPTILSDANFDPQDPAVRAQLFAELEQGSGPLLSLLARQEGLSVDELVKALRAQLSEQP